MKNLLLIIAFLFAVPAMATVESDCKFIADVSYNVAIIKGSGESKISLLSDIPDNGVTEYLIVRKVIDNVYADNRIKSGGSPQLSKVLASAYQYEVMAKCLFLLFGGTES